MTDSATDPLKRFDGLAAGYDRYRPDYPAEAIDYLIARCALRAGQRFIDIGAGTGISTRMLAARGLAGIGIEPNADMRRVAEAAPCPAGPAPEYRSGRAEATGLPDSCAALVIAAQAFHWFPTDAALHEFHRILEPGGWAALLWNEQDHSDPFTLAYYRALLEVSPEPALAASDRTLAGEILLTAPLFTQRERRAFAHAQPMDLDQLLGRAFSASYAPREGTGRQRLEDALRTAFAANQRDGRATMRYRTVLYLGRKAPGR